ncbi:hypothetical protein E2C01_056125 [Portunus trituberculatus]|uniref:Uncharacterized protein n=1 Tax=Portunus trituberculatus TaxID=210409 RepID=A0A5B7GXC1_PORTR|nr:hypothetical protein [Portunus trituberculatus]
MKVTGGPVREKHGLYLGDGMVYDQKVLPTPLEFRIDCTPTVSSTSANEFGQNPPLSSLVSVLVWLKKKHLGLFPGVYCEIQGLLKLGGLVVSVMRLE